MPGKIIDVRNEIKKKLEYLIDKEKKIPTKILLMLSGGVDSMVLAHCLIELSSELNIELGFFHLDHMYRKEDSFQDYIFVKKYAEKNGIQYFSYRRNIFKISKELGIGFELCARNYRRSLAMYISNFKDYKYISTAHHKDDNAESILLNFIRGSGLKGLSGMPVIKGKFIRPILDLSKKDIEIFAKKNSIPFRTDYTNFRTDYSRNKVRLEIIPKIMEINPNFPTTVTSSSNVISEDLILIEELMNIMFSNIAVVGKNHVSLNLDKLKDLSKGIKRRILRKLILFLNNSLTDVYLSVIDEIVNLIDFAGVGKYIDYKGIRFELRKTELIAQILKTKNNDLHSEVNLKIGDNYFGGYLFNVSSVSEKPEKNTPMTLVVSEDFFYKGIVLRYRETGDYIRPVRLKGHKKSLKKLFVEHKLTSIQKKEIPLLCNGSEVIWAVGVEKSISNENLLTTNKENKKFIVIKAFRL